MYLMVPLFTILLDCDHHVIRLGILLVSHFTDNPMVSKCSSLAKHLYTSREVQWYYILVLLLLILSYNC